MSGLIEAAIPLVTQARELGLDIPIIGGNGFNSPQLMADAGEAAEGVIVGAAWNSRVRQPRERRRSSRPTAAKYGGDPDQFAAQAYTGMYLLDAAVRAGCSADREAIKDNLGGLERRPDARSAASRFDENRDAVSTAAVVQVVEGGIFTVLD